MGLFFKRRDAEIAEIHREKTVSSGLSSSLRSSAISAPLRLIEALLRGWLLAFIAFGCAVTARAHNLDTSYVRFSVTPDALETEFTFDIFTLFRIVPGLDANGDRVVTHDELRAQAPRVFDYLRTHVAFEINSKTAEFGEAAAIGWPTDMGDAVQEKDWHSGGALIHFKFRRPWGAIPEDFHVEFHVFDELGERHTIIGAVQNAGREEEILFSIAEPDYIFDTQVGRPTANTGAGDTRTESQGSGLAHQLARFFRYGVEHIFTGYDHILFLLALIVVSRLRELVKIVTSFTVAHTITLILSALQIVRLPLRLVEAGVAATIIYVALENFWIKKENHRWMLTFGFGLIHGFSFARVLSDYGLPRASLVRSLLCFNVGVEVGQLAIVCMLFPVTVTLANWKHGRSAQLAVSAVIFLFGCGWLIERVFNVNLRFMP